MHKRKLYKEKYTSIYEFAAKLAGMNEATVNRILSLEQKLTDKPTLREQFETGKVGWNEVMQIMFQRLEGIKRNIKGVQKEVQEGAQTGAQTEAQIYPKCVAEKRESGNSTKQVSTTADDAEKNKEATRYIPSEVRKVIAARSHGVCEFHDCNFAAEIYHHTRRFALKKNHDPTFIRALCKKHEGIMQAGLVTNEEGEPSTWNIRAAPEWWDMKNIIDEKVAAFRREPAIVTPPLTEHTTRRI